MAKAKTQREAVSFTTAVNTIADELFESGQSPLADKISSAIKRARDAVDDPCDADPTELLTLFHPSKRELNLMGLPEDFLKDKCSNHTALYMADFTRFKESSRARKKKGKKSRRKK